MDLEHEGINLNDQLNQEFNDAEIPEWKKIDYFCKLENARVDTKNEHTGKVYEYPRYQFGCKVLAGPMKGRFLNLGGPLMPGPSMAILKENLAKMEIELTRLTHDGGQTGDALVEAIEAAAETGRSLVIKVTPNEDYPANPRTRVVRLMTAEEVDKAEAGELGVANESGKKDGDPF